MAEKYPIELIDDIYLSESYLVGLFWNNPDLYSMYPDDKISYANFGNRIWKFYFYLGRLLFNKNIKKFDDITVEEYLSTRPKIFKDYESFGEYSTIYEIMQEVKDKDENFDGYYENVKKYNMLRELYDLLGEKILKTTDKYDYKKLNAEQIGTYWSDKINSKLLLCESKIEEYNLLEGLKDFVKDININPSIGLPFNNSKDLTNICNGWDYGNIYIYSAFSGKGKSSFTMNKVIMACIKKQEKLLIIANEMGVNEYKKLLLVTVMGNDMYDWLQEQKLKGFHRQNIDKGNFNKDDLLKLEKATQLLEQVTNNKYDLVKFVPLDIYTLSNVEKTIRYYANRGYKRIIIDTAKPTEGSEQQRWVQFTNDFEKIYKLTRPEGGGLNLALWTTVQNADSAVHERYLDESCLGDAKKIKNVAGVFFSSRNLFDDEYSGEKHELKVYSYSSNPKSPKGYEVKEFTLDKSNEYTYMLLFTPKNRRGQSNDTGLDILVYKVNFNSNRWQEIGWTKVYKGF